MIIYTQLIFDVYKETILYILSKIHFCCSMFRAGSFLAIALFYCVYFIYSFIVTSNTGVAQKRR